MGRGIDSTKRELWNERLRRFEGGGLTVAEFCRNEQVSIPSFYQWRKKFRRDFEGNGAGGDFRGGEQTGGLLGAESKGRKQSTFVAVRLRQFSQVEVELVNGVSLRLPAGDLETLKATILIAGQLPAEGNPRGRVARAVRVDDRRAERSDQRAVRSC